MKRCITCQRWYVVSDPYNGKGWCLHSNIKETQLVDATVPGYSCKDYTLYTRTPKGVIAEQDQLELAKMYLLVLIWRERAEIGSLAHKLFCREEGELYKQLRPQMQLNVHMAFRQFLENPNIGQGSTRCDTIETI